MSHCLGWGASLTQKMKPPPKKKQKTSGDVAGGGEEGGVSWLQLPQEIWLVVLRFLPVPSLVALSATCPALREVCQDPALWTRLSIDWQSIKRKTQSTEELMTRCSRLERLRVTNRTFEQVNSPMIVSVIKRGKDSLRELVLSPEIALANNAIGQLGLHLGHLTSLELAGDWLKTSAVKDLSKLTKLRTLKLPGAEQVTPRDLKELFSSLAGLEVVDVSECRKGATDMSISALATNNPGLQYLALDECELVTGKCLKVLASHCPQLGHLSLDGCYQVNDPGLAMLASCCLHLTYVSLGLCSSVKDNALLKLGSNCKKLSFLNLFGCAYLSEKGITKLLKEAEGLSHLDIRGILGMSQTFSEKIEKENPTIKIVHQFQAKPPRERRRRN